MERRKKNNNWERVICGMLIILIVVVSALIVGVWSVMLRQKNIESQISYYQMTEQSSENAEHVISLSSDNLLDQTSIFISIVTGGIAVFTIFGGFFSFFNLMQSKELSTAIEKAEQAVENQKELISARLIQDGRNYMLRSRPKYAEDCFLRAVREAPDTENALIAQYEIMGLYADTLPIENDSLKIIEEKFHALEECLKKTEYKGEVQRYLKGDLLFVMGCVYGKYAEISEQKEKREELLNKSIDSFEEAITYDGKNVDYYRNLAVSYAVNNEERKCIEKLDKAEELSKKDKLYAGLMARERLCKLFQSSGDKISGKVKKALNDNYKIKL